MKPLKKALTYEQQIEHLKNSHGLEIPNLDSALNILKRVNYYRLSAYGIGLKKDSDPEMFQDGISIDYIFDLYSFDSSFRSLVLHTVEQIEIQLRTQIAYYLSLKYGAEGYLNPDNFINKIFPVLLVIKRMLDDNQELWDSFFIDLCSLIKDHSNVLNLSFIGFPTNWKSVLSE